MKNSIIISLGIMFFFNVNAQIKRDYAYYNHQIDSLIFAYSVEEIKLGGGFYLFRHKEDSVLSAKDKKRLIVKIGKMFEQKKYTNLYSLGHTLIFNMYCHQEKYNTVETKQMLMELFLQYYFYPGRHKYFIDAYNPYAGAVL